MPETRTQLDQINTKYPLESKFKRWVNIAPSVGGEKEKALLVDIFKTIISRLRHYSGDLEKPEKWDSFFIKDVVDNLDYCKDKAVAILEKKIEIKNWGKNWATFFVDAKSLFRVEFLKMRFDVAPILLFFENNSKSGRDSEKMLLKKNLFDPAMLEKVMKVFDIYQQFTSDYGNFIRELEGLLDILQEHNINSVSHLKRPKAN